MEKLDTFTIGKNEYPVKYLSTDQIKDGVECDVYSFIGDESRDLAIVRVQPGCKTPLQKVLTGDETIEGFLNGSGTLFTVGAHGEESHYNFHSSSKDGISVHVGESMQWQAGNEGLTFYELCTPPYKDGRFENLSD